MYETATAPATAKYARIVITGVDPASTTHSTTNFDNIELRPNVEELTTSVTINPATDADVTLLSTQYAFDRLILADGSWTAGHNIIVPIAQKTYFVDNSSGTYDAVIKTSAGTGITVLAGKSAYLLCDGTNVINPLSSYVQETYSPRPIHPISYVIGGSAITLTLNPTSLDFRSTTLTSGVPTRIDLTTAISVTVSNGSTLGTISGVQARIAILAINNAGTVELAVCNAGGGLQLDEANLITTVAEGGAGAADSSSTIYSTTARTSVPYRVVGFIDITEATAGAWITDPTLVQGTGGMAFILSSSPKYTNVTASRTLGSTYYNDTGYDLDVAIAVTPTSVPSYINAMLQVDGVYNSGLISYYCDTSQVVCVNGVVPSGSSYTVNGTNATKNSWRERRRT